MREPIRTAPPDFERFRGVITRSRPPDRVHFLELGIDAGIMARYVGEVRGTPGGNGPTAAWELEEMFYRLAGYDYVRPRLDFGFANPARTLARDTASDGQRSWSCEGVGCIEGWAAFESYPWPAPAEASLDHLDWTLSRVPDGMGVILAGGGGIFEWATELLGLEGFCMLMFDQPALVEAVVRRIGERILGCLRLALERPGIGAFFLGDDMGFKSATLVAPDDLRRLILPWHARIAEACHAAGLLYILHSCGNLAAIMDDLIDTVGIDGKHSFEDVILPVEEAYRRWGARTAILGGIDVDILAKESEDDTRARTRTVLEACQRHGSYALGSGNTIANYCRYDNYLAMLQEGVRFGGK